MKRRGEYIKQYRLIEITRENNERYGKCIRTKIFEGPDKADLQQAIKAYHQQPRKPWAETAYYYGCKQIYAYEL